MPRKTHKPMSPALAAYYAESAGASVARSVVRGEARLVGGTSATRDAASKRYTKGAKRFLASLGK